MMLLLLSVRFVGQRYVIFRGYETGVFIRLCEKIKLSCIFAGEGMQMHDSYKEKEICDEVLGTIRLRRDPRALHYSLRVRDGQVIGTLPVHGDEREMLAFIGKKREKLLELLERNQPFLFDEDTELQTLTFRLRIFRCARTDFYMTLKEGVLHIACPDTTDFKSPQVQELLRRFFERALRHEAVRVLPERLERLAKHHGFSYTKVNIRNMKTRWGSCSERRHISLTFQLMLLPAHLLDYVLLHELCHTVEMNHGERFWQLMDRVTDGKTPFLRKELRKYGIR